MSPLMRLYRYTEQFRYDYFLAAFYSVLNKLFDIAPEILIGIAVDTVVKQEKSLLSTWVGTNVSDQLIVLGIISFVIWLCESLSQYLYAVKWGGLAQKLQHILRSACYRHVQQLDMAYFSSQTSGRLLSILNDDVNQLERFLEDGINQIIQVFVSSLVIGAIFFVFTPYLAVLAMIPVPFILVGAFYFQNRLAPRFWHIRERVGHLSARLNSNLQGIVTIKSFTAEEYEAKAIEAESVAYLQANREAIAISSMVTPIIRIAVLAGFLSTLVYGGFLTLHGQLGVGVFSILVFLTQRLLWPLTRLADITVLYQRAMASIQRIMDLLETPITTAPGHMPLPKHAVKGALSFSQVSFGYEPGNPILHSVSLDIQPGETIALVGSTGSGKTTLIKLLLRLYEPSGGTITLDGQELRTIELQDLRRAIGIVTQDVFLFQGTIAENIAYALPHVTEADIIAAATRAEAHEFIMQLPEGYQTIVGERGQKLSGGQRQRIALARAILKDPPILILDEATSAVDNETELAIQRSLDRIVVGRTTLMIAHRLSTIRNAQKIVVLEQGRIMEIGTHDTLLQQNGRYALFWKLQTGEKV